MTITRLAITAGIVLLAAARPSLGQAQSRDAGATPASPGLRATRQVLQERAARLEEASASTKPSEAARADARRQAGAIRARLAAGDFAVGDRIWLVVQGEKELSDTFAVGPGRLLALPVIGDVPLEGVLRSELQEYLTRRLARNLRDPEVRAQAFVRLSIQGAVARPGYYAIPAEALLSDALMAAGGTTQDAQLPKLTIERAGKPIWEGPELQQAIAAGRTLDDAGLMAGDQYFVPPRGRGASVGEVLRFTVLILSIPATIFGLSRVVH